MIMISNTYPPAQESAVTTLEEVSADNLLARGIGPLSGITRDASTSAMFCIIASTFTFHIHMSNAQKKRNMLFYIDVPIIYYMYITQSCIRERVFFSLPVGCML